jgi:hypothetical protein
MEAEAMLARVNAAITGRSHGHSRLHDYMAHLGSGFDQDDHTTSTADASNHHAGPQQPASRVSARAAPAGGVKAAGIRQGVVSAFSGMVEDLEEGGGADVEGRLEATVRRIMEGAQLQILELQYQERQSQLVQEIEGYQCPSHLAQQEAGHQHRQSQLVQQEAEPDVSHQQGQQQWRLGGGGVHAATRPHYQQLAAGDASSAGGAESSQGGGIYRQQSTESKLPLRAWRQAAHWERVESMQAIKGAIVAGGN